MSAPIKIDHFQSKQLPRIITTHGTPPDGRSRTYLDKAEEENDAVPSSPMSWSAEILELGHHNRASNPPTFRIPRKVVSSSVVESPIDQNKHKSIVPSVSHGDKSSQWSIPSAPLPVRKQRDYNNNIVGGHGHGGGMVTPTSPRDRFERNMEYELALGKRGTVKSKQSSASSVMVDVGEATVSHDGVRQVYMRKKSQVDRGTRGIGPGLLVEEYHDNSPGGGAGVAGGTVGGCAGKLDSDCLSPMSFYSQDQQQQHHHHQHHQIPPLPRTLDSVPTIPATLSYPPRSQQSSLNTPREIPRRQDSSAPLTHPYRSNELESARLTPQLQSIPQTTQNGVQVSYSRPGFSPAPAPQSQYRPDGSSIGQGNGGGSDCESLWDGNDASDNPRNWGMKKKSFNTLVVSLYTFVIIFTGAVYIPGHGEIANKFSISHTSSLVGFSLFTLGLIVGHPINAILSEMFGRKPIYGLALPLSCFFTMGAGLASSFGAVVACKLFSAIFASPAIAAGGLAVADMWEIERSRLPVIMYLFLQYSAPCFGPLVGGFAVHYGSWRWTMWITLLGSSIVYTLSYFLSETHKATILRRRLMLAASIQAGGYPSPHSTRVTDGDSVMSGHGQQRQPQHSHAAGSIHNPSKRTWRDFWACVKEGTNSTIVEAGKMLVLEKLVTCLGIYLGFIFGCFYAQLVAFPIVYTKVYGLDPIGTGFTSMAIFGGMFLAGLVAVVLHLTVYKRAQHRVMMGLGGKVPPEERLGGALVGSMVLPIALFVCAWSERASVHWSVSILGGVGVGFGLFSSLLGITLYLQDVYPAEQLISVFSAAAALQYLVGAVFPLFVSGMYETMSVGWAGSVFAFVSLVFVPVPWVLWRFGRDLRAESRWGVNVFCEKERR